MKTANRQWQVDPKMDRVECAADSELAAELAATAADSAVEWSRNAGVGEDDAAEAVRASTRARLASERAIAAQTDDEARTETAAAWAATESALEADQRVVEAIARALLAA